MNTSPIETNPSDAVPAEVVDAVPSGTQRAVLGYVGPRSDEAPPTEEQLYAAATGAQPTPSPDKVIELTSTATALPGKATSIRHWLGESALRITKIEGGDAETQVRRVVAGIKTLQPKGEQTIADLIGGGITSPLKHILAVVLVNKGTEERQLTVRITCHPTFGGAKVDPSPSTRGARPVPNRPLAGVVRRGVPSPKPKPAKKAPPPIMARNMIRHGGPRKDPMVPKRPNTQSVPQPQAHASSILDGAIDRERTILLPLGRYEAEQVLKLVAHGAPLQTRAKLEHMLRHAKDKPVPWSDEHAARVNASKAGEVAVRTAASTIAAALVLCHGSGHALRGSEAGRRLADDVQKAMTPSRVLTVAAESVTTEDVPDLAVPALAAKSESEVEAETNQIEEAAVLKDDDEPTNATEAAG